MTEKASAPQPQTPRGCLSRVYRVGLVLSLGILALALAGGVAAGFGYRKYVVQERPSHFDGIYSERHRAGFTGILPRQDDSGGCVFWR